MPSQIQCARAPFTQNCKRRVLVAETNQTRQNLRITIGVTVAILAQGTSWADAVMQAFLSPCCTKRLQRKARRRARQKCRELGSAESSPDSQEQTRDTQTEIHRPRHTQSAESSREIKAHRKDAGAQPAGRAEPRFHVM